MNVRCGDCSEWFELSPRNASGWRRRGLEPRCRSCRGIRDVKPPTQADRDYWLQRFTLDEIRAMAQAIWPEVVPNPCPNAPEAAPHG